MAQRRRPPQRRSSRRPSGPVYVAPVLDPTWKSPYEASSSERDAREGALQRLVVRRVVLVTVISVIAGALLALTTHWSFGLGVVVVGVGSGGVSGGVGFHPLDAILDSGVEGLELFAELVDAALAVAKAGSMKESAEQVAVIKQGLEGTTAGTAVREFDWTRLARSGAMMGAMKERSEAIRRGLRRPKDPAAESRQPLAIALMALVLHGDTHAVKDPSDKPAWQEACLELQGHMSRAAAAIKSRDGSAVDHFRMGMEACDKCHQKFKP